jgi:hypothetical protein
VTIPPNRRLLRTITAGAVVALVSAAPVLAGSATIDGAARGAATAPGPLAVSPTGADNRPCTATAPCASLQRAFDVAKPGQHVVVLPGSYPGQTLSGDKGGGDRVVFEAGRGGTVTFVGRLVLSGLARATLRGFTFSQSIPYQGIELTCTHGVTLEGLVGKEIAMLEGNRDLVVRGGSWGGGNIPSVEEDPGVIGGNREICGASGSVNRNVLIDGVTFHDSYWGATSREAYGSSHPDCFQFYGGVDGVTIRNSAFIRCGDSFIGAYPDFGDIRNIVIEKNVFRDLGNFTFFGMQFSGTGHPHVCQGITFRGNVYWPNNPQSLSPYSTIRTNCGGFVVTGNLFQDAPSRDFCETISSPPVSASWRDNVFVRGACGTTRRVPWGYVIDDARLVPDVGRAAVVRRVFALARRGLTAAAVAKELKKSHAVAPPSGWRAATIRAIVAEQGYLGGVFGRSGSHPAIVARSTWRAAQRMGRPSA